MGPSHVGVSYHPEFQVLVTQLPSSTSAEELNVCSMITFVQSPFCFHLWSWMTVYQLHMEQAADVSFSEVHHETIGVLVYYLNSVRCPKHFSFTRGSSWTVGIVEYKENEDRKFSYHIADLEIVFVTFDPPLTKAFMFCDADGSCACLLFELGAIIISNLFTWGSSCP